jgi:hypothetical protein
MEDIIVQVQQPQQPLSEVNAVPITPITLDNVLITLLFASLLSAIMYFSFKKSRSALMYDQKFNVTLVMIAIVVTLMMQLVQSNIALSVGIMGSLSIVRFRTNTRDPRDLGFVFWAMGIGLASATSNWLIGIIGTLVMSIFVIYTSRSKADSSAMLVVIRGNNANVPLITDTVMRRVNTARLKAQNLLTDSFEVVYEIKTSSEVEQSLLHELMTIDGVDSVNMLAPSAEVAA